MEKIICAAIWYQDLPDQHFLPKNLDHGLVVCGHRHGHCIDIVKVLSGLRTVQIAPDGVGETTQGFLTDTNRFVNREDALLIAKGANQLNGRVRYGNELYSEDIY